MSRIVMAAMAMLVSLGDAHGDDGCNKFAWPLAKERAAFASTDKPTVKAGDSVRARAAARRSGHIRPAARTQAEDPGMVRRQRKLAGTGQGRPLSGHAVRRSLGRRGAGRPLSAVGRPRRLPRLAQDRAFRALGCTLRGANQRGRGGSHRRGGRNGRVTARNEGRTTG